MKSLVKGDNIYIENVLFYFFVIGIDFILVMYIEVNHYLVFITITYILGIIIPLHILKFRNFLSGVWEARGLILYDLAFILCFIYLYYALPAIHE